MSPFTDQACFPFNPHGGQSTILEPHILYLHWVNALLCVWWEGPKGSLQAKLVAVGHDVADMGRCAGGVGSDARLRVFYQHLFLNRIGYWKSETFCYT